MFIGFFRVDVPLFQREFWRPRLRAEQPDFQNLSGTISFSPANRQAVGCSITIHRNKEAEALLREHGCWFLFLPPYIPDLNPIEMAFSKLKAHLRRVGARSFTSLFQALGEICELYTPQECWNYFCQAGYASA